MKRVLRTIGCLTLLTCVAGFLLSHDRYTEVLSELGNPSGVEEVLNEELPYRGGVLSIWQGWMSLSGRRYFADSDLFIHDSGQYLKGSETQSLEFATQNVSELKRYCDETGRNFLYVVLPGKPYADDELRELGISCERNAVADSMVEYLAKNDIACFDARSLFSEESAYSHFFKTDHHWTPDAGLLTSRALLEQLNRRFGYGFDASALDDSRFIREVVPEVWTGEYGEKALGRYAQKDDFIVLKPSFPAHLRYQNLQGAQGSEWMEGDFDVLLDEGLLENADTVGRDLYYYYLHNTGIMEIENQDVEEGNLLIIKDSFSNVMLPYLALGVGHIKAWDMREDSLVYEYLEEHPEVETVMIAYTISFVPTTSMNDYR